MYLLDYQADVSVNHRLKWNQAPCLRAICPKSMYRENKIVSPLLIPRGGTIKDCLFKTKLVVHKTDP